MGSFSMVNLMNSQKWEFAFSGFLEPLLCTMIFENVPSIEYGSGLYHADKPSQVICICMIC